METARFKLRCYNTLSPANRYLVVLAKKRKVTIVTTDHRVKEVREALVILSSL